MKALLCERLSVKTLFRQSEVRINLGLILACFFICLNGYAVFKLIRYIPAKQYNSGQRTDFEL